MRLSRHAFVRFWDLHAWVGVVSGLVLYVMFLTGAVTLFHEPLGVWEEPLASAPISAGELDAAIERGLAGAGELPDQFRVHLPHAGRGAPRLGYYPAGSDTWTSPWIDPATGALIPERERLAGLVYELHYLWHDATGVWLYYVAGLLAVAMLVALVTGVLIHLKGLARQLHQFRPRRTRRVLWSDMHKVLGVMGLPFQLMFAYTGAFIVLAPLVLPAFVGPVFDGDGDRAQRAAYGRSPVRIEEPGPKAKVLPASALIARARAVAPDLEPQSIVYYHHGHANAVVDVRGQVGAAPTAFGAVRLREADGETLAVDRPDNASGAMMRWIYGLHFGHFGGWLLRFLYFALALATGATILTGNWIWIARRDPRQQRRGNRVLARLTVGVGAGCFVALAALFAASRILPLDWSGRGAAEELSFAGALAGCIVWALASRAPRGLWWRQLGLAGALFIPVPLLATSISDAGLFGAARVPEAVAVDLGLLAIGAALLAIASALRRAVYRPGALAIDPDRRAPCGGGQC